MRNQKHLDYIKVLSFFALKKPNDSFIDDNLVNAEKNIINNSTTFDNYLSASWRSYLNKVNELITLSDKLSVQNYKDSDKLLTELKLYKNEITNKINQVFEPKKYQVIRNREAFIRKQKELSEAAVMKFKKELETGTTLTIQKAIDELSKYKEYCDYDALSLEAETRIKTKNKKSLKKTLIAGLVFVIIISIFAYINNIVLPKKNYESALDLLRDNNVEEAYQYFVKTHQGDSDQYSKAIQLAKSGKYDEAISTLSDMTNKEDTEVILNYIYDQIIEALKNGEAEVSGYQYIAKDYISNHAEDIYKTGIQLIENKNYLNALITFKLNPTYSNSDQYSNYCQGVLAENDGNKEDAINWYYNSGSVVDAKNKLNILINEILFSNEKGCSLGAAVKYIEMLETKPGNIIDLYNLSRALVDYEGEYKAYQISNHTDNGRKYSAASKEKELRFSVKKGYVYCYLDDDNLGDITYTSEQTPFSSLFRFYDYYEYEFGTAGNSEGVLVINKNGDNEVVWCPTYYGPDSSDYLTQTFYMRKK